MRRLRVEQTNALYPLRTGCHLPFLRLDPDELAPLVVAEWQARHVTELRDRVRQFLGWLAAFDAALTNAALNGRAGADAEEQA